MRFCLIGCGGIASSMHAPAYVKYKAANPDFELVACCDPIPSRASQMKESFHFKRFYTDHQSMLSNEKPDAVAVIVNEELSSAVGMDVIDAGIPMLIEKPPGRSSKETMKLAHHAAQGKVPCQVAFNRRYMPSLQALKSHIQSDVQLISYEMIRHERRDRHFSDTAIHGIDAVRYLMDADYRFVRFSYTEMPGFGDGVCNISMDCEMTNGVKAHLLFMPMSGASLERVTVHTRGKLLKGYLPIWGGWDSPGYVEVFENGNPPARVTFPDSEVFVSNGFFDENKAFFDALKSGEIPTPSISGSVNSMLVKECIDNRQEFFSRED